MPTIKLCDWCGSDASGDGDEFYVVAAKGGAGSVVCEQMTGAGIPPYPLVCRTCRMALWTHQFDELVVRHAMLSETYPMPIYALDKPLYVEKADTGAVSPKRFGFGSGIALLIGSFALLGLFCVALVATL
jgi:hypothetical protein